MKTDDLIAVLARDAGSAPQPIPRRLALALALSAAIAFALLMIAIKPRPDLARAATTMLFDLKLAYVATIVVGAMAALIAMSRPEGRASRALFLVPALLILFGLGHELATQAPANYLPRLIGRNWAFCMVVIPVMAAGPLVAMLIALRVAAPADPARAGAMAGLAAGAVAALFYGLHCADDSPLFVVTWYSIAFAVLGLVGAALGRRLLSW